MEIDEIAKELDYLLSLFDVKIDGAERDIELYRLLTNLSLRLHEELGRPAK